MACVSPSGFLPPAWADSGFPPPLPPINRGDLFNELYGLDPFLRQIGRDARDELAASFRLHAEEDHAGAQSVRSDLRQVQAEVPIRRGQFLQ